MRRVRCERSFSTLATTHDKHHVPYDWQHGPSTRLVETSRARQHGPCWRVMETGYLSRQLGPLTRVINLGSGNRA